MRTDEIKCWNVEMAEKKSGTIKGRFSKMNGDGIILIGLQQSKENNTWLISCFISLVYMVNT